jgi:Ca2+-binding EF-hand superfamily protein
MIQPSPALSIQDTATTASSQLDAHDFYFIKNNTQLNTNAILDFYKTFLSKFNNGCVNREQFGEILHRLVIVDDEDKKLEAEKMKMCELLFDICDKDDNGFIDFKEYLVLFWSRANGSPHQKLSLIFDMFDLNGNNAIDFHEMHSIVRTLFKLKYSRFADKEDSKGEFVVMTDENNNIISGDSSQNDYNTGSSSSSSSSSSSFFVFNSTLPPTYHIAMNIMKKFDANRNGRVSKEEFVDGCLAHPSIKAFLTPLKVL